MSRKSKLKILPLSFNGECGFLEVGGKRTFCLWPWGWNGQTHEKQKEAEVIGVLFMGSLVDEVSVNLPIIAQIAVDTMWVRIRTIFCGGEYSEKKSLNLTHSSYSSWIMKLTTPGEVAWFKNEKAWLWNQTRVRRSVYYLVSKIFNLFGLQFSQL